MHESAQNQRPENKGEKTKFVDAAAAIPVERSTPTTIQEARAEDHLGRRADTNLDL